MLDTRPSTAASRAPSRRLLAGDAAAVLGVLLLLGVLAGLLWPHLVDPVEFERTANGITADEVALAQQFDDDGWYVVLAAVAGAVAGGALTLWRDRDPVATVLLLLVGASLAAWVSTQVGTAVGPPPVRGVLEHARVGTTAPAPVQVQAWAAYLVWPIAALFGAVVVLWSRRGSHPDA
jgi:hypothetical protein